VFGYRSVVGWVIFYYRATPKEVMRLNFGVPMKEKTPGHLFLHRDRFLLLKILSEADGPLFGTEIVSRSGGRYRGSSVHPFLSQLESVGLISSKYENPKPKGRTTPRRLYSITEKGRRELDAQERRSA
jgi:hypothetical protein